MGWSDSDWAGCIETRKSTSGGVVMHGDHCIKTWSSTQDVIALSSGEAEYYALVKTGSQCLGMKAMMADLGILSKLKFKTDASAAKGISMRRGLGKVRHIEVNQLWLQDKIHKGHIELEKVDGKKNLADALTKLVEGPDLTTHLLGSGLKFRTDRHYLAPVVAKWESV